MLRDATRHQDLCPRPSQLMPPPPPPITCHLVDNSFPAAVYTVRDRVLATLGLTPGSYMTLHLRRGDGVGTCDTSIGRVIQYLDCSMPKPDLLPEEPMHLLIFTDETDSGYLNELLNRIGRLRLVDGVKRVVPVHGDRWVDSIMHDAVHELRIPTDNYFNYEVGIAIQIATLLPMELRRHVNCPPCYTPRHKRIDD